MKKNPSYELFIAFWNGFAPKDLIERGYPKLMVYSFYRRYNKYVRPNYSEKIVKPLKTPAPNNYNAGAD